MTHPPYLTFPLPSTFYPSQNYVTRLRTMETLSGLGKVSKVQRMCEKLARSQPKIALTCSWEVRAVTRNKNKKERRSLLSCPRRRPLLRNLSISHAVSVSLSSTFLPNSRFVISGQLDQLSPPPPQSEPCDVVFHPQWNFI